MRCDHKRAHPHAAAPGRLCSPCVAPNCTCNTPERGNLKTRSLPQGADFWKPDCKGQCVIRTVQKQTSSPVRGAEQEEKALRQNSVPLRLAPCQEFFPFNLTKSWAGQFLGYRVYGTHVPSMQLRKSSAGHWSMLGLMCPASSLALLAGRCPACLRGQQQQVHIQRSLLRQLKAPPGRTRSSKNQGYRDKDLQGMNALISACLVTLANSKQHLVIIPHYLYLGV